VRRRTVFSLCGIVLATFVAGAVSIVAQGTKEQPVETKAQTSRGGKDTNIKSEGRVNDKAATGRAAPAQKGGEKPRGGAICDVHFDNRTPWWLDVYVDGDFEGNMPPWGDVYTYAIAGPTILYGRARFTDGSILTWGPVTVRCPAGGSYEWRVSR